MGSCTWGLPLLLPLLLLLLLLGSAGAAEASDTAAAAESGGAAQDADCLLCWPACSLLGPMLLLLLLPKARVRCLTELERLWRLLL